MHGRDKRDIHSTSTTDGHAHHISLGLTIGDENVVFDLQLNRDLLTEEYFEKLFHNGSHTIRIPDLEEAALCHYQGFIKDRPGSWAALSTCDGVRGVVFDGKELHYLEPIPAVTLSSSSPHYLLSHKHLIANNLTCGYTGKPHPVRDLFHDEDFTRLLRYKRDSTSTGAIRGPYNANFLSRYVELILVADKTEYEKHGSDVNKIYQRFKDIANIVNALYQPLNIFIALIGVEIWQDEDPVDISTDGDKTLTSFLTYRKVRLIPEHPNDNAQLLTGKVFDAGVVGKALKGPICTYQYSGGVNMDHSDSVGLVATTVAHEMGHNFGMEHDTEEDCKCPDKRCIMAPSSGTKSPSHWSSCSHEYLAISFERSMDYCLRNKPTSLFNSPVCGNGFVEPGEQCDCGLPEHCHNHCCNATSCMLYTNATCATGHCCDLQNCKPKEAGVECRAALHECDLAEYCSGDSEYCPDNFYKEDGHQCLGGKAYCYSGMCRTHEHQCRLLWGPTGKNSHDKCYNLNREGDPNGNCGYNWANKTYKKCDSEDVKCGMMHCKHFNERLEFGLESVSKVNHRFIPDKAQGVIPCRVAQVDLGLDMVDPGLAPDGAKCGYKRMCVGQRCMEVASLQTHICDCSGRGVCNNLGHCHCDIGFSWPDCNYPGLGGSVDSGPASNPNATSLFVVGLLVLFLGIVPLMVVILCLVYYVRGNLKLWLGKSRPATSRFSGITIGPRPGKRTPSSLRAEVSKSNATESTVDGQTSTVLSPSPPSSQGSKCNSPLLNGHANGTAGHVQPSLFGKYEGFRLSPIKDKLTSTSRTGVSLPPPPPPPPPPPLVTSPIASLVSSSGSSTTSPSANMGTWRVKPHQLPSNVWNPGGKVDISQPSLQTSTNPAVGASDNNSSNTLMCHTPLTTALQLPVTAIRSPSRRAPDRPKSVPDASSLIIQNAASDLSSEVTKDHGKTSTVSRIASFLSKKDKSDALPPSQESSQPVQSNTLPRKATKINRESLLQLEISHPMQLQATELPSNLVPVRPAPDPPMPSNLKPSDVKAAQDKLGKVSWASSVNDSQSQKQDIIRIGSVREPSVTTRPPIPKFGSVRVPRPKSLPPPRPSQPPPRPPLPLIPGTPESDYFYDDVTGGEAPLAVGEETTPQEGIYATIDEESPAAEIPEEKKDKKSVFSLLYAKTKKKKLIDKVPSEPLYCNIEVSESHESDSVKEDSPETPAPIITDRSSCGSSEDGGLLSEIVSELASREPQYVNTLTSKERKKNLPKSSSELTENKGNKVYIGKSTSFPWKTNSQSSNGDAHLKECQSSSAELVKQSPVTYSNVKPRGVFSFFKSSAEENPSLRSKQEDLPKNNTAHSSDETSISNKGKVPKTGINASSSVPGSLAATLAGIRAAREELSAANKMAVSKSKTDSKLCSESSIAKSISSPSVTSSPIASSPCIASQSGVSSPSVTASLTTSSSQSTVSSPSVTTMSTASCSSGESRGNASVTSTSSITEGTKSRSRVVFPPDKVLQPPEKPSTTVGSKAAAVKKPTTLDLKPGGSVRGRGLGSANSAGRAVRITSPSKDTTSVKDALHKSSSGSISSEKGRIAAPSKKPIVSAKVDSGFKGKVGSKDKLKERESSSSSLKESIKIAGIKKASKPPATSSKGTASASSRSGMMAAASKSGPNGTSHVASLQQKFEKESQDGKPPTKPVTKK